MAFKNNGPGGCCCLLGGASTHWVFAQDPNTSELQLTMNTYEFDPDILPDGGPVYSTLYHTGDWFVPLPTYTVGHFIHSGWDYVYCIVERVSGGDVYCIKVDISNKEIVWEINISLAFALSGAGTFPETVAWNDNYIKFTSTNPSGGAKSYFLEIDDMGSLIGSSEILNPIPLDPESVLSDFPDNYQIGESVEFIERPLLSTGGQPIISTVEDWHYVYNTGVGFNTQFAVNKYTSEAVRMKFVYTYENDETYTVSSKWGTKADPDENDLPGDMTAFATFTQSFKTKLLKFEAYFEHGTFDITGTEAKFTKTNETKIAEAFYYTKPVVDGAASKSGTFWRFDTGTDEWEEVSIDESNAQGNFVTADTFWTEPPGSFPYTSVTGNGFWGLNWAFYDNTSRGLSWGLHATGLNLPLTNISRFSGTAQFGHVINIPDDYGWLYHETGQIYTYDADESIASEARTVGSSDGFVWYGFCAGIFGSVTQVKQEINGVLRGLGDPSPVGQFSPGRTPSVLSINPRSNPRGERVTYFRSQGSQPFGGTDIIIDTQKNFEQKHISTFAGTQLAPCEAYLMAPGGSATVAHFYEFQEFWTDGGQHRNILDHHFDGADAFFTGSTVTGVGVGVAHDVIWKENDHTPRIGQGDLPPTWNA